jgi:hypothetical protein
MRVGWYSVVIATVVVGGIAATAAHAAADGGTVAGGKTVDITGSCDGGGGGGGDGDGGGGGGAKEQPPTGTEDTATPNEETLVDTHGGCWDKALNGGCGANGPEERESMEVTALFFLFLFFGCSLLACPIYFSSSLVMVMAPHCHTIPIHAGHIPTPCTPRTRSTRSHPRARARAGPHHSRALM